ncbi:hypothetical protein F4809DRAFT_321281 [Biscogniauxia mediterranea]|nr:hypothetical protein F4809DRAFT_321281 [Biscogniauxia mediterranea]
MKGRKSNDIYVLPFSQFAVKIPTYLLRIHNAGEQSTRLAGYVEISFLVLFLSHLERRKPCEIRLGRVLLVKRFKDVVGSVVIVVVAIARRPSPWPLSSQLLPSPLCDPTLRLRTTSPSLSLSSHARARHVLRQLFCAYMNVKRATMQDVRCYRSINSISKIAKRPTFSLSLDEKKKKDLLDTREIFPTRQLGTCKRETTKKKVPRGSSS